MSRFSIDGAKARSIPSRPIESYKMPESSCRIHEKGGLNMAIEFLTILNYELDMVKDLIEPKEDLQPGDEPQGTISEELKKLYTVWKQTGMKAGALENELRWGAASGDQFATAQELKGKAGVLNVIFWAAVQDELHLWHLKEQIAIRKGYQVVACKGQGMPPFFRFFMGGPE